MTRWNFKWNYEIKVKKKVNGQKSRMMAIRQTTRRVMTMEIWNTDYNYSDNDVDKQFFKISEKYSYKNK